MSRKGRERRSTNRRNQGDKSETAVTPPQEPPRFRVRPELALFVLALILGLSSASLVISLTWPEAPEKEYFAELDPNPDMLDITMWVDFNCPHCRDTGLRNLPEWYQKVFDPGYASYRQANYPFLSDSSFDLAIWAACAEKAGVLEGFTQSAFEQEGAEIDPQVAAGQYAEELEECVASGEGDWAVNRDMELGDRAGIKGTPAFHVDGIKVKGEEAVAAMEQELKQRE